MTVAKTKINDKVKCDRIFNEMYEDKKFYAYLHKVMINTYDEYYGLHNVIEIEDFKSECFMKIYKSLDLFDESKGSIKTFCILCIKSTALQTLRTSRATRNKLMNRENLVYVEAEINNTDGCKLDEILPGKEDEYFTEEFQKEVLEGVDKLPPREKQTMLLRLQGYKTKEIAEILNTSGNNVNNRLTKARHKLRKYLNIK